MGENYITCQAEKGSINISEDVLLSMARAVIHEIAGVAYTVLNSDLSTVEQMRLPINDSYVEETRDEQSMLYDCDWTANATELYNFIYE